MGARNGVVETLDREERAGVGVRALIGSSWGFFAVPDVRRGRAPGRRAAAAVARASALVAGPDLASPRRRRLRAPGARGSRGPVDRRPRREGRPPRGGHADDAGARRGRRRGHPPHLGHPQVARLVARARRVDQHIVECGAAMNATVVGEGETQRRSATRASAASTARAAGSSSASWTCPGNAAADRRRGAGAADRRPVPLARRHRPDPGQRADGAPDPRVGRPRDGARPDPRLGGGVRRHLLARPRQLGIAAVRLGADEHHRRRDAARRARQLRLRRRGDAGPPASTSSGTASGSGALSGRDSAALAGMERSGGAVRADGFDRMPMVRMTNVGLLPGDRLARSDDRRDRRRHPHGHEPLVVDRRQAAELPVRLRDRVGDQGRQARRGCCSNPTYTAISPRFWGSMDMLGGPDEWTFWGTPNCGKGQPMQIGHTGHPGGAGAVPRHPRGCAG